MTAIDDVIANIKAFRASADSSPLIVDADLMVLALQLIANGGASGITGITAQASHPFQNPYNTQTSTPVLPANGGSVAMPVLIEAPMSLQSMSTRQGDSTLQRDAEWRLYFDTNLSNLANEIAGAHGVYSFLSAAIATRFSNCTIPPIPLTPGLYWLVLRNTHAANVFTLGSAQNQGAVIDQIVGAQTKTIGSLGPTLDMVTGWTKIVPLPQMYLNGRIFGQASGILP
jgi:hypothetical protein